MEEKRFYLTRVKVISREEFKYNVGEVYCAIADRYDLENMSDDSQPYGIIHTPIDAAKVVGIIAEANKEASPIDAIVDPCFIDWVFKGDYECEEV